MITERKITASHEAAHVVVAFLTGIPVMKVWIYPTDDRCGEYRISRLWFVVPALRGQDIKRMYALVVMAGQAYQEMLYPDSHVSEYDSESLKKLLLTEETVSYLHHHLMGILLDAKVRGTIHQVSHLLEERGCLSEKEIRKLIG